MAACSIPECSRPARSRFQPLCGTHYERQRLTGTTERRLTSEAERFWAKVDKTDGCWLWTGALTQGYGVFRSDGTARRAHRVSWALERGPIPSGMQVDHECHNADPGCLVVSDCAHRRCVNPAHLRIATNAENSRAGKCGEVNATRMWAQRECLNGHQLTGDNVRLTREGYRQCRECERQRRGVTGPPRRVADEELARIGTLIEQGVSRRDIAAITGVGTGTIWRMQKAGRL